MALFLSYAREDREVALVLYQDLLELRGDVFMDHSILAGQEWWDTICDAIEATDLFVFVLSDVSLDSEACQSEVTYALAMKRPFLPLAVGDVRLDDLPIEVKRFQVVPYDPGSKENYKQIVKAIAAAGTAADPPDPRPERPALPESYADAYRRTIASPALTFDEQVSLFAVLREHTTNPKHRTETLVLIGELRGRRDLAERVANEIDAFLATESPPLSPAAAMSAATAPDEAPPIAPAATDEAMLASAPAGSVPEGLPPPPLVAVTLQRVQQSVVGAASKIALKVDGEVVGKVKNGQTIELQIPAGHHSVQAKNWWIVESDSKPSEVLELDLVAGQPVTLQVRFPLTGGIEMLRLL